MWVKRIFWKSGKYVYTLLSMFKLHSPYSPTGDQPEAIAKLMESIDSGHQYQTLLGVT